MLYAKWYKPDTEGQILYDFKYMRNATVKLIKTESRMVVPRSWEEFVRR